MRRPFAIAIAIAIAVALALGATLAARVPAAAQMRAPASLSAAQLAQTPLGGTVELVVRVKERVRSSVRAELLERRGENAYAASGVPVVLYVADGTPVLMGGQDDLRAGAILSVAGVVTGKRQVDAKRVVVLSAYARIVP